MSPRRYDVLVVGAGPAGSIAALVLARAGARVALLDKARFPRDKACGDFIGPRGLAGPGRPRGARAARPRRRRHGGGGPDRAAGASCPASTGLPTPAGPGRCPGWCSTTPSGPPPSRPAPSACEGRAGRPARDRARDLDGFEVGGGRSSGPTSSSAPTGPPATWPHERRTGRRGPGAVGVRGALLPRPARRPAGHHPVGADPRGRPSPATAGSSPGPDGVANVGRRRRHPGRPPVRLRRGAGAARLSRHLVELGLLDRVPDRPGPRRLGGWLKMGMVGTVPAAGRVLLVGDAAGLVNPLQGEGIAQAMTSGRAAAEAVLGSPGAGGRRYRRPAGPGPPALPADHRRRPCRPGGPAAGRGRGRSAAHRAGGRPGPGRRMGDLLERAARRGRPGARPAGGRGVDRGWGGRSRPAPASPGGSPPLRGHVRGPDSS